MQEITCLPLSTILNKYALTHVNFFTLDVEGGECMSNMLTIGVKYVLCLSEQRARHGDVCYCDGPQVNDISPANEGLCKHLHKP